MKTADIRQLIVALLITVAAGVPLYHAVAYNVNDIVSVNINEETANNICKSRRVLDGLKRIQDGYLKQIVQDTINEFKSAVSAYAFQLLLCAIIPDKTVNVGFLGNGASFTFKKPSCNWDMGGAVSGIAKRAALDQINKNFAARCIADGARKKVGNDIRQITRENGPDGGPAFVSDWTALYVDEDQRAIKRFNAILVNTHICPYFRDAVYEYFGVPQSYINQPPAISNLGLRVDGTDSFSQKAQCTLPDNFTPEQLDANFLAMGGYDALVATLYPANNFDGFIRMANEELAKQRDIAVEAAVNEAVAGGGFRGVYGDASQSCLNRDPDGFCLALGPVQQPAGAIRDANAAAIQGEIDWINNSQEMNQLMGDVRSRVASMVLSLNSDPLDYVVGPDQSSQDYQDIGAGTIPPESIELPELPDSGGQGTPGGPGNPGGPGGPGGPGTPSCGCGSSEPACTGGNDACFSARGCTAFSSMLDQIDLAVRAACFQFPALVDSDVGCGAVISGSERAFLDGVCSTTGGEQILSCRPSDTNDGIVADLGGTLLTVKILATSGAILHPGQPILACNNI